MPSKLLQLHNYHPCLISKFPAFSAFSDQHLQNYCSFTRDNIRTTSTSLDEGEDKALTVPVLEEKVSLVLQLSQVFKLCDIVSKSVSQLVIISNLGALCHPEFLSACHNFSLSSCNNHAIILFSCLIACQFVSLSIR